MHANHTVVTCAMLLALLGAAACDQGTPSAAPVVATPAHTPAPAPAPDNTANNKDDARADAKTPLDQSEDVAHIKITADIRTAIMDDKTMSMNAQNCKIITDKDGMVTLRGVVDTQAEKDAIQAKAEAVAGAAMVRNELEVKTS